MTGITREETEGLGDLSAPDRIAQLLPFRE